MIISRQNLPYFLSSLQYANSGPSCQQVCLVSELDGQTVCTGVAFLSLFSDVFASIVNEGNTGDQINTIIVPIPINIIKKLLLILSSGEVVCDSIEETFDVALAANLLGVVSEDWKIDIAERNKMKTDLKEVGSSLSDGDFHIEFQESKKLLSSLDDNIDEKSSSKSDFVNLYAMEVEGGKYSCDLCNFLTTGKDNMGVHMEEKHDDLGCSKCCQPQQDTGQHSSDCKLTPTCKEKRKLKANQKVYPCSVCGKIYKSKATFDNHYKLTHLDDDTKLDIVHAFAKRVEGDRRKQDCTLCVYRARDRYNMKIHLERKHSLSPGYHCSYCNQWTKSQQDLSKHELICNLK